MKSNDEQKVAMFLPIAQLTSIMVQGAAGTGKTATVIEGLKCFVQELIQLCSGGDESVVKRLEKAVLILAYTNKASAAVNG